MRRVGGDDGRAVVSKDQPGVGEVDSVERNLRVGGEGGLVRVI